MRRLLIVNPYASRVRDTAVNEVARALDATDVVETEARGHATELVRDASRYDAIFVFSGDGGFNEAVNGADGTVPLGFVPGGNTSVLPRVLGLPRDPVEAARQLASGRTRRVALGRVNGRRFTFSAGLGLDAEAVRRVDALGRTRERGRKGDIVFARTLLGVLSERRARFDPTIHVAGHGRAAFALVAKCDPYTYAGPVPLHVAPAARFELGLDLVAPRRVRARMLPRLAAYVLLGRGQQRARDIIYVHDADRLELRCDEPMPLQADGEDLGDVTEVVLEAERDALDVLV